MAEQDASDSDILLAQRIISAAGRHDVAALKVLLKEGSANVKDPSGTSPLHAAVLACEGEGGAAKEDEAVRTVELLLQNGAIWNDLNKKDETPGCIAFRLKLEKVYEIMVAAGVRAELLFGRLKALGLDNQDDDEDDEDTEMAAEDTATAEATETAEAAPINPAVLDDVSLDNHEYLKSPLRFKPGILLDRSDNAVMMDWEKEIMIRHAETLLPTKGLRAVNIGHGMGIVDRAIQDREPSEHHIIEAHPQVQARLREQGWYDKPGVRVHEGRWQDILPKLVEEGVVFDAIYYDTFAEDYYALKELFSEWVIQLLDNKGRFGWYNGLGADRQICYDVYTKVAEMDLADAGFDTAWEDVAVPSGLHGSAQWDGTRRPYWTIDIYKLPVNTFME
jgi:protein arginine N-methyltransferase 2